MGLRPSKETEYKELEQIGRGAFGEVFLCRHVKTKQLVADKQIATKFLEDVDRRQVEQEAVIMRGLVAQRHPHIVALLGTCLGKDGVFHIYMEYCPGGQLKAKIDERRERREPFANAQVLTYLRQIAEGLAFIHSKKVIHRDLKPENILLDKDETLKIADFGVSAALNHTASRRRTTAGTMAYMAPEVIQGEPYTMACDVWSMGVVGYELVCLKQPFTAKSIPALLFHIAKGKPDPMPADASVALRRLVTAMMDVRSARRPVSRSIADKIREEETHMVAREKQAVVDRLKRRFETERRMHPGAANVTWSLLHFACDEGDDRCVDLLLQQGAEVDKTCSYRKMGSGWTPLHVASYHDPAREPRASALPGGAAAAAGSATRIEVKERIVKALLKHGANKQLKNSSGKSALEIAHERIRPLLA